MTTTKTEPKTHEHLKVISKQCKYKNWNLFTNIRLYFHFFFLQMKEMMEQAGNSHLLTVLSYPNAGHLIEPPYTPHARASLFRSVATREKSRFNLRLIKSGLQTSVLMAVSVFLCSDCSVGRRDSGTFSCSGRRLEETAGLSEGESVQWHKLWYNFIVPPVTKATTNRVSEVLEVRLS